MKLKWFSTFVIFSGDYNLLRFFSGLRIEQDFPLVYLVLCFGDGSFIEPKQIMYYHVSEIYLRKLGKGLFYKRIVYFLSLTILRSPNFELKAFLKCF